MYAVYRTERFDREVAKLLSVSEQQVLQDFERRLASQPLAGKPLRYPFFREKRFGGKRVYYLVYERLETVLLVAASGKKTQQATIESVLLHLEAYDGLLRELLRRRGGDGRS